MEEQEVVSTEVAEEVKEEIKEEVKEEVKEEAEEVVVPKKKTAQERIDELTRKRREAERDAEYWKQKALDKEKPAEPARQAASDRPRLDQFETTEQYEDALFEWRDRKRENETRESKRKEEYEKSLRSFNERAKAIREEHDDFDEIADTIPLTDPLRDALAASENGPELVYYLGTHAAEHSRIINLPVVQQLVELGRIETKMLLAKQTKKVSEAPPPIKPVGSGGGKKTKDPSEMTDEEYWAWDKKQTEEKIKKKYGG